MRPCLLPLCVAVQDIGAYAEAILLTPSASDATRRGAPTAS